jgi:type I restriction enzyme, S subunit
MRPGYKETEIGIMPEDWVLKGCAEICLKIQDGTHFSPKIGGAEYLYITSRNIGRGILDISSAEYINEAQHRKIYKRCDVRKGDLLLTKDGVNTGNAAINHLDDEFSLLSSVAFLRFDLDQYDPRFFLQFILSHAGQKSIQGLMSGNAITRLTLEKIRQLQFPVPSLVEQRAIAAALSDVDGLLAGLDRLIAKKRAVKTAVMQQLLTGEVRVGEGNGRWETKRLREIASLHRENVIPVNYPDDLFIHFSLPAFDANKTPVTEPGFAIGSNKFRVPHNAILVSKLNPRIPRIWAPHEIPSNSVASTEFLILTPHEIILKDFLFTLCVSSSFCSQMELMATGTTGSHQRVNPTDALDIEVAVPTNVEEQHAIAAILSDIDAEIAALEARRAKTAAIKQGMMQELLTGRTRLVDS